MPISEYTDIANCQLLLKHTAGVFSDSGSTPAVDGDSIQQWNDQSGSGNHATATGAANTRPIYSTAAPSKVVFDYWRDSLAGFSTAAMDLPPALAIDKRDFTLLITAGYNNLIGPGACLDNALFDILLYIQFGRYTVYPVASLSAGPRPNTGKPCVTVLRGSAGASDFFINTVASKYTLGAFSAGTATDFRIGRLSGLRSFVWDYVLWDRALTDGEITDALALAASRHSIETPTTNVVLFGDSRTAGFFTIGLLDNWVQKSQLPTGKIPWNHSYEGQTAAEVLAHMSYVTDYSFRADAWVIIRLAYNDIVVQSKTGAETYSYVSDICSALISAGYQKSRIVVATENGLANVPQQNVDMEEFNSLLYAGWEDICGRIWDLAVHPTLGRESHDGSLFYDVVHENPAGNDQLAISFIETVPELFETPGTIDVTAPTAGERKLVGETVTVEWDSSFDVTDVDILLSLDGGSTYAITIVSTLTNTGTYAYMPLQAHITATAKLKVRSSADALVFAVSDEFIIATTTAGAALFTGVIA